MKKKAPKDKYHIFIEKLYFFMAKKKVKLVIYSMLIILLSISTLNKFFHFKKSLGEKIKALDIAYLDWQKEPTNKDKYNKLINLINKNPTSKAMLEPDIAQRLIYENDPSYKQMASRMLAQHPPHSHHAKYSEISLLVAEKKYEEAYSLSLELKNKMDEEKACHLAIYPYNLFRICMLAKELRDSKKELEGWSELEKHLNEKETSFVTNLENINQFNLKEFISQRKSLLE